MGFSRITSVLIASTVIAACSDSNTTTATPPISISTPNADRCEILDNTHCLFPWPSNAFTQPDSSTATGLKINLNTKSLPTNKAGKQIAPVEWNKNDGFSPSQMLVLQVSNIDLNTSDAPLITDISRSLDVNSPIQVIEASTGKPHLVFAELDVNATTDAQRTLLIRPMKQFKRGERYIVVLKNLKDSNNQRINSPKTFAALRDKTITNNPAIEQRRATMEAMFKTIEASGNKRSELYLAWDFTVASAQNITERMLHIRDTAFTKLGNDAPEFQVSEVINFEKCDYTTCPSGVDPRISREIHGYFKVPSFLNTTHGEPGSSFYYANSTDALPSQLSDNNDFTARFICRIPRSVAEDFNISPITKARASLYGHGLLGQAEEIAFSGSVNGMADEYQFMFCATD